MSNFNNIQQVLIRNFNRLTQPDSGYVLFNTEADPEDLFRHYLAALPEEERQPHNCRCCYNFFKRIAGVIAVPHNADHTQIKTLWDFSLEEDSIYYTAVNTLRSEVAMYPLTTPFLHETTKKNIIGVPKNAAISQVTGEPVEWTHFYVTVPKAHASNYRASNPESMAAINGKNADNIEGLRRSLEEISDEALQTVVDLIHPTDKEQQPLYRGEEQLTKVINHQDLRLQYKELTDEIDRILFVLVHAASHTNLRSSVIGSLLKQLDKGIPVADAVASYEDKVSAGNFKRNKPVVSKRQLEQAQKVVEDLGLMPKLARTYASKHDPEVDLSNDYILHVNRDSVPLEYDPADPFKGMIEQQPVDPSRLARVTKISMLKFILDVVPNSVSIQLLLEQKHTNKFMTLVNSTNKEGGDSLFPWGNGLSWSYKNGMADSIKERVKKQGGDVTGDLRISLSWNNSDDLDLAVKESNGSSISYSSHRSEETDGELDIDMNASTSGKGYDSKSPVENITYPDKQLLAEQDIEVRVNQYAKRCRENWGYTVEIEYEGEILSFTSGELMNQTQVDRVCTLKFDKDCKLVVESNTIPTKGAIGFTTVNNLDTNKFHQVSLLMKSPNQQGNKHLFFILNKAIVEEPPRGFFNEMLRNDLHPVRKSFECLANLMEVQPLEHPEEQLTGIGFSSTLQETMIVKVDNDIYEVAQN